jgi:ribosome maturation factor RimP
MDRDLIPSLWSMIEPVLDPEGIELVDVEYKFEGGRWVLRLFIDTPNGVTLADCELVSREVGALLDIKDPIEHRYVLEVSSPGINRVLRKEKDFQQFAGSPVWIRTRRKLTGRRNFRGILKGIENSAIVLEIDGARVEIEPQNIEKANLDLAEDDLFRKDLRKRAARAGD